MKIPTQTEIHMFAVEAMLRNAEEVIENSRHDASISQSLWMGEKQGLLKVHRMLKSTVTEEQKVPLAESLALIKPVKPKSLATYNKDNTQGYVPLMDNGRK